MKSLLKITTMLFVLLQLSGCGDDSNEKSKRDVAIAKLTHSSWSHAQVTNTPDGDLSSQYENFVIAFSSNKSGGYDGTYIISNGGYAFSENAGKWKLSDTLDKITLDSGKEMEIQLEEEHLQLDFTVAAPGGGRAAGLSGHFVFELQPL